MTSVPATHLLQELRKTFADSKEELDALDRAIGDGDHGSGLLRGFEAAAALDHEVGEETLPAAVAKAFVTASGGASAMLFGALLQALSESAVGDERASTDFAQALAKAAVRVGQLGKAEPGDKSMLDALLPAVEAARTAAAADHCQAEVVSTASVAAAAGAESTKTMRAKRGRARYVEDGGYGHMDPGARSVALALATYHRWLGSQE